MVQTKLFSNNSTYLDEFSDPQIRDFFFTKEPTTKLGKTKTNKTKEMEEYVCVCGKRIEIQ